MRWIDTLPIFLMRSQLQHMVDIIHWWIADDMVWPLFLYMTCNGYMGQNAPHWDSLFSLPHPIATVAPPSGEVLRHSLVQILVIMFCWLLHHRCVSCFEWLRFLIRVWHLRLPGQSQIESIKLITVSLDTSSSAIHVLETTFFGGTLGDSCVTALWLEQN